MKVNRRFIAKIFSYSSMLMGMTSIIIGVLDVFAVQKTGTLFFLLCSISLLLLAIKFAIDFNPKNKRNDILWICVNLLSAVALLVMYFRY